MSELHFQPTKDNHSPAFACGRCQDGWIPCVLRVTRYTDGKEHTETLLVDPVNLPRDFEAEDQRIVHYSAVKACACRLQAERAAKIKRAQEAKTKNRTKAMDILLNDSSGAAIHQEQLVWKA